MKKTMAMLLAVMLCLSLALTGCTPAPTEPSAATPAATGTQPVEHGPVDTTSPLKICLLVTGNLGDKSFFDSANDGLMQAQADFGDRIETKVVQVGADQSKYEPALAQVASEDYDLIVVMGWIVVEHLQTIAAQYPEKNFIIMDSSVDYSTGDVDNVYSVEYKSCDASFMAGALAAKMTTSGAEGYNDANLLGFVGAIDIPVINDFLVGYIQGAQYVSEDVKMNISYVGNFDDSAKAKELAITQYGDGVDILFSVASVAGLGTIDAAAETGNHVIGVDSDQAALFADTAPNKSDCIPTSVLKNTGASLYRSIEMHLEGTLPYGTSEMHGLAEGGVGIAENSYYEEQIPADVRDFVEDLKNKLASGEIVVQSAYGMEQAELDAIRSAVQP